MICNYFGRLNNHTRIEIRSSFLRKQQWGILDNAQRRDLAIINRWRRWKL